MGVGGPPCAVLLLGFTAAVLVGRSDGYMICRSIAFSPAVLDSSATGICSHDRTALSDALVASTGFGLDSSWTCRRGQGLCTDVVANCDRDASEITRMLGLPQGTLECITEQSLYFLAVSDFATSTCDEIAAQLNNAMYPNNFTLSPTFFQSMSPTTSPSLRPTSSSPTPPLPTVAPSTPIPTTVIPTSFLPTTSQTQTTASPVTSAPVTSAPNPFSIWTLRPSQSPTIAVTPRPTTSTARPTSSPAVSIPTTRPTLRPTFRATLRPSQQPSLRPTRHRTRRPTRVPVSTMPTSTPTNTPSTLAPTSIPTPTPTATPISTNSPTSLPSSIPSTTPTINTFINAAAADGDDSTGVAIAVVLSILLFIVIIGLVHLFRKKIPIAQRKSRPTNPQVFLNPLHDKNTVGIAPSLKDSYMFNDSAPGTGDPTEDVASGVESASPVYVSAQSAAIGPTVVYASTISDEHNNDYDANWNDPASSMYATARPPESNSAVVDFSIYNVPTTLSSTSISSYAQQSEQNYAAARNPQHDPSDSLTVYAAPPVVSTTASYHHEVAESLYSTPQDELESAEILNAKKADDSDNSTVHANEAEEKPYAYSIMLPEVLKKKSQANFQKDPYAVALAAGANKSADDGDGGKFIYNFDNTAKHFVDTDNTQEAVYAEAKVPLSVTHSDEGPVYQQLDEEVSQMYNKDGPTYVEYEPNGGSCYEHPYEQSLPMYGKLGSSTQLDTTYAKLDRSDSYAAPASIPRRSHPSSDTPEYARISTLLPDNIECGTDADTMQVYEEPRGSGLGTFVRQATTASMDEMC